MKNLFFLPLICTALLLTVMDQALGQKRLLGKIDFPNSGSPDAQDDFIEGMLFLHNFEYEDAARAFRRAQQKDPDFALAYYGEAKTHNHPIWMQQDREAAIEVLKKLAETPGARMEKAKTQREKDYLHTIEVLYGNTPETENRSKEERDDLYMDAMSVLHEKYPEDHEATAFYGLSILGTAHEGRDFGIYMKAAAELFDIWYDNKKHPGAAHYLIHSFDDPIHAPLGLPMARAYSEIAPDAAHAQHMTSHIFLALGMWDGVVSANIVARRVQTNRQRELNEKTTVCGHYPWWLQYGYLQRGDVKEAGKVLETCHDRIKKTDSPDESYGESWHFAVMRGHQVIDSEEWEAHEKWTADIDPGSSPGRNYHFTTAFALVQSGELESAREALEQLRKVEKSEKLDIQVMQIESLLFIADGETDKGITLLKKAVEKESALPISFGPPTIVKPSHELLGDTYLKLGKNRKALQAYEKQLERTPKRRRSLIGKRKAQGMASN
ncbi:MAG: hypothetical protein R3211_10085 [Balneolaceae bacterium]|nr:hypothetical protein [Balneolaceae bacterium]